MNQNTGNVYIKLGILTLVAIILGIISGIVWPSFFDNPIRFLLTELILTGSILLVLLFQTSVGADHQNKCCQTGKIHAFYYSLLLLGAVIGFVVSLLGITTTLTAGLYGSIVFGIAVGAFVIILGLLAIVIKNRIDSI